MAAFFGRASAFVLIMVLGTLWSGYVLSVLWAWFAVPTFAAPVLSIPAAIGIALVVQYLTHQIHESESKPFDDMLLRGFVNAALKPLVALAFGAVVRLWM